MATNLITIDPGRLSEIRGRLSKAKQAEIDAAEQELDEYGSILVIAIQREAPRDEGLTAQSVKYKITGRGTKDMELVVQIGSAERPEVVIKTILFGSRRHVIEPKKRGGWLHWVGGGEDHFAKRVNHPGTKPNDFMQRAWDATATQRRAMIARIGRLVVDKISG